MRVWMARCLAGAAVCLLGGCPMPPQGPAVPAPRVEPALRLTLATDRDACAPGESVRCRLILENFTGREVRMIFPDQGLAMGLFRFILIPVNGEGRLRRLGVFHINMGAAPREASFNLPAGQSRSLEIDVVFHHEVVTRSGDGRARMQGPPPAGEYDLVAYLGEPRLHETLGCVCVDGEGRPGSNAVRITCVKP